MRRNRGAGFTLIEISIVLVVVGLLLGLTVTGITPVVESSKTANTNTKLDRVELALLTYVLQNGCLPCPADGTLASGSVNAGWSQSTAGYYGPNGPTNQPCSGTAAACSAASASTTIGVVPWNTLGLGEGDIVDGWNSRIGYAVDPTLAATPGESMNRSLPASYPAGAISVTNNAAASQTAAAAYVLISYGRDRAFAYAGGSGTVTANPGYAGTGEVKNSNGSTTGTTFIQDTVNLQQGGTSYFDDIVRFRTAPAIILDCGANACGNPAS